MRIFLTGDTHGSFEHEVGFGRIVDFCQSQEQAGHPLTKQDIVIILGDAGIKYCHDYRDEHFKNLIRLRIPCALLCLHGNHELRPESIRTPDGSKLYHKKPFMGGEVWCQKGFSNILFAVDGSVYNLNGLSTLAIGGAYSVDKHFRLANGYRWFPDEQPSEKTKRRVESVLEAKNNAVDVILSHTVPFEHQPTEFFMNGIDQSTVDNSTEHWLQSIHDKTTFKHWYAGHFHCDKQKGDVQILYTSIIPVPTNERHS